MSLTTTSGMIVKPPARGLAAGAGIVALVHRSSTPPTPAIEDGEPNAPNIAMGAADFGVDDPGSWDDGSGALVQEHQTSSPRDVPSFGVRVRWRLVWPRGLRAPNV
jgi:hypothetical protein